MKKTIIIPGFGESGNEKEYKKLVKSSGGKASIIKIDWNYRTMSTYIAQAKNYINKKITTPEEILLIGFSFGAFIALQLAKEFHFGKVISCSCAPYFKENLKYIPRATKVFFGTKRMKDFSKYSIDDLRVLINKNVYLLFGDKDWNIGIDTSKIIAEKIKSPFALIKETEHELTETYIREIKKLG